MNIVVLATATRIRGTRTIYKQFIEYLPLFVGNNKWLLFIDSSMEQPVIDGVDYFYDDNHGWLHRIYMDSYGFNKIIKERNFIPDCVFSLQNIGLKGCFRQVLYYHQPLPFYSNRWNILKKSEFNLFLYKHFYPLFVKRSLNNNTDIIVQIPYIARGFVKVFNYPRTKVYICFPDIETIEIDNIPNFNYGDDLFHIIYPASAAKYKNHNCIIDALSIIKKDKPDLYKRIKIHFTLNESTLQYKYASSLDVLDAFVFEGQVDHSRLLSMYKTSTGLLFPSCIETLGLPLLEAAAFGLPIIAADIDYAHEVIEGYCGVSFVDSNNTAMWVEAISRLLSNDRKRYEPLSMKKSSWPEIFDLILKK